MELITSTAMTPSFMGMELCLQMLCNFLVIARNGVLAARSGMAFTIMTLAMMLS